MIATCNPLMAQIMDRPGADEFLLQIAQLRIGIAEHECAQQRVIERLLQRRIPSPEDAAIYPAARPAGRPIRPADLNAIGMADAEISPICADPGTRPR